MRPPTGVEGRPSADRVRASRTGLAAQAAAVLAVAAVIASACGTSPSAEPPDQDASDAVPTILATTGIWSDVVSNVACDGLADVETIIPVGGDPHGYEPSLQDRERMEGAALVVANGLELEEGLEETLEAVEESGTPVFEFAAGMDTLPLGFEQPHDGDDHDDDGDDEGHDHEGHDHDDDDHDDDGDDDDGDDHDGHDDDGHDDDDHDDDGDDHDGHDDDGDDHDGHDDDGHDHSGGVDPHVWFDPHRVSEALPALARALTVSAGLDPPAVQECMDSYRAELAAIDAEIAASVEQLPAASRKLVTNHEALGYFADRYGFEVVGTVIPTPASMAQANPSQLEELAKLIEREGVKALFAEAVHSTDDMEALASRVGDVEVVTLYTGSLGPAGSGADTYVGFLRTNATLIVDALS